jgi:hypothetical protein
MVSTKRSAAARLGDRVGGASVVVVISGTDAVSVVAIGNFSIGVVEFSAE